MFDQIEEKAKKAKDGNESSIRELADAVFDYASAPFPQSITDSMKDRLVRAELDYRKGHKGIREGHIANTVNDLADTSCAPDFAKTDALQVQVLRVRMMHSHPSFLAQERDETKNRLRKKVSDDINREMSPLEGVFLAMMMVQQKLLNDDFQKTPKEFAATVNKEHVKDVIEEALGRRIETRLMAGSPRNHDKMNQMDRCITTGLSRLSLTDAINLADKSLDTLGIKR